MNRLDPIMAAARQGSRKLLCPFLTAGYPSLAATPDLLLAAQAGGASILELGIPFSDPVADGPIIQASFTQALASGTTLTKALNTVAQARAKGLTIPVLAMVSFSIIFKRGTREFAKLCADNALDGIILPDVPLEEAPAIVDAIRDAGLRSSLLVAPTTPEPRRHAIARLCDAFVYYLSVSGITGERTSLPANLPQNIASLRQASSAPICVGFGISTPEHVRQVTQIADGAIVGSALIRQITANINSPTLPAQVQSFITNLAGGLASR